jgi:heterodisulfide reductase subunit C
LAAPEKRVVKLDDLDSGFAEAIAKAGGEKINSCIQCGTCTASCPSGKRTAFKTRQLIRKALLGLREPVLSDKDLWLCTTCYTCLERCPRSVDPTDVILAIRTMAVQSGHMLDRHKLVASLVLKFGHAVPIDDTNRKQRVSLGLTELPPTTHIFSNALAEVQKLAKRTSFDKIVGYEWK